MPSICWDKHARRIEDFSDECPFRVGQRVHLELKNIPKADRHCEVGVIKTIMTRFLYTPEMRSVKFQVVLDAPYVKKECVIYEAITDCWVFAKEITLEVKE